MSRPIVAGYRHTGIIVKDMAASLHFYRDILGLEVIQELNDGSDYINKITGTKGATAHIIKMKAPDGTVLEILEYFGYPTELIPHPIYNAGAAHVAPGARPRVRPRRPAPHRQACPVRAAGCLAHAGECPAPWRGPAHAAAGVARRSAEPRRRTRPRFRN